MNKNTETIQWQVCTREQANRLKELGADQKKSLYYWDDDNDNLVRSIDASAADIGCTSAYTVAELGEMLPTGIYSKYSNTLPDRNMQGWIIDNAPNNYPLSIFDTEAQARAAMLIYLLEKNLITL